MTKKLREYIKKRDNFTCCNCGNSTHVEPNLLLEIDHIIPVSKGGVTSEENLQTLCWKCNRAKSDKIVVQRISRPQGWEILCVNVQIETNVIVAQAKSLTVMITAPMRSAILQSGEIYAALKKRLGLTR